MYMDDQYIYTIIQLLLSRIVPPRNLKFSVLDLNIHTWEHMVKMVLNVLEMYYEYILSRHVIPIFMAFKVIIGFMVLIHHNVYSETCLNLQTSVKNILASSEEWSDYRGYIAKEWTLNWAKRAANILASASIVSDQFRKVLLYLLSTFMRERHKNIAFAVTFYFSIHS